MLGLGVNMGSTTPRWNPRRLFLDGTQGCHFDPSDLSTVFQDAAGTIPGAVGSPVGLMLDKSQGLVLGPEHVVNGDFSNGTAGWTANNGATLSVVSGELVVTSNGATYGGVTKSFSLSANKTYEVRWKARRGTANIAWLLIGNVAGGNSYATLDIDTNSGGVYRFTSPITGNVYLTGQNNNAVAGGTSYWDNISIRELPGNHASQSTSSAKPILRQDAGGRYYLEFDGVDDRLILSSAPFQMQDDHFAILGVTAAVAGTGMKPFSVRNAAGGASISLGYDNQRIYGTWNDGTVGVGAYTVANSAPAGTTVLAWLRKTGNAKQAKCGSATATDNAAMSATAITGCNIGSDPGGFGFWNGRIYGLIVRKATTSDDLVSKCERWLARKSGVAL